jgi:hypothetical protein
LEFQ